MLSFTYSPPILTSISTYILVTESYRSARVVRAQGSTDPLGTRFLETPWSYLRYCGRQAGPSIEVCGRQGRRLRYFGRYGREAFEEG
jgi:hypothetical protein